MSSDAALHRTIAIIAAVIVLVPLLMMIFMMPMMGMWDGGHMWNGGMWDGMGTGWVLLWVIFVAILAVGAYLLYRAVTPPTGRTQDRAVEELRIAYARGELTDEEFEARRERLLQDDGDARGND